MNRLPTNPIPSGLKGCFLAGGSILSIATKTEIADYDIYPKSKEQMMDIFWTLEDDGCFLVNVSDRAVTWKSNEISNSTGERTIIQVMTFDEFKTAEQIFEYFDFSVCMAAFDADSKTYHFHQDFWPSVASRTLYFNPKTRFPLNSAIRVGKYTAKGFFMPKPESIKMSLAVINSGMPTSWDQLEAAIGGVYGKQVKLATEDKEYSYEAALELLDNLVMDFTDRADEFSLIKAEQLELVFSGNPIKVLNITPPKTEWMSIAQPSKFMLSTSGLVTLSCGNEEFFAAMNVPLQEIDPEELLTGYKILAPIDDGKWTNVIHRKKLSYEVGAWVEDSDKDSKHIFIFPNLEAARQSKNIRSTETSICKFSFHAKDVVHVNSSEYRVRRVRFDEVVVDTNEETPCTTTLKL